MSLKPEVQERLIDLLDELEDPNCGRYEAIAHVLEHITALYKSPFYGCGGEPLVLELALLPLCVRLGVAVKIVELEQDLETPVGKEGFGKEGFDEELSLAVEHWENIETLPKDALSEGIWWLKIMPAMVDAGYNLTTGASS